MPDERIGVKQHQVRPFADLDRPELVNQAQEGGRPTGRGANCLCRREPGLDKELEFLMERAPVWLQIGTGQRASAPLLCLGR